MKERLYRLDLGGQRWRLIWHERGVLVWMPRRIATVYRSMRDDRWAFHQHRR